MYSTYQNKSALLVFLWSCGFPISSVALVQNWRGKLQTILWLTINLICIKTILEFERSKTYSKWFQSCGYLQNVLPHVFRVFLAMIRWLCVSWAWKQPMSSELHSASKQTRSTITLYLWWRARVCHFADVFLGFHWYLLNLIRLFLCQQ